jgi:hypothetical protein
LLNMDVSSYSSSVAAVVVASTSVIFPSKESCLLSNADI